MRDEPAPARSARRDRPPATVRTSTTILACWAALAAMALYVPAVGFGLTWDDPDWLRRAMDGPWWSVFGGTASYQFYRPLTVLYSRLWPRPDGRVAIEAFHAAQVTWHGLATLLLVVLAWRLTGRRRVGVAAGAIFAVAPLAHQPVSWAAAHQPLSTCLTLLALILWTMRPRPPAPGTAPVAAPGDAPAGGRGPRGRDRAVAAASYAAFVGAMLAQESATSVSVVFGLLEAWRSGRRRPRATLHLVLAGLFAVAWAAARRRDAFVGGGYDARSLAFLMQAPAWPVLGWLGPLAPDWMTADPGVRRTVLAATAAASAATALWLGIASARRGRGRLAALYAVWALPILLLVWSRLSWDYLRLGQRLVYPALPPIAIAWAAVLDQALRAAGGRRRLIIGALTAGTTALAIGQIARLHGVAALGASFVGPVAAGRVVPPSAPPERPPASPAAGQGPGGRAVVVNFPDRIALARGPLPLGWWGQVVAPIGIDLAQFADWRRARSADRAAAAGAGTPLDTSCAVPAAGAADRARRGLRWDLRGAPGDGEALLGCAGTAAPAAVFVAEPADGPRLRLVGAIAGGAPAADGSSRRACGPDRIAVGTMIVRTADLGLVICVPPPSLDGPRAVLTTRWAVSGGDAAAAGRTPAAVPDRLRDVTPFVHLEGGPGPVVTADGDLWGGTLPLDALARRPRYALQDIRTLPIGPAGLGTGSIRFGLYRRADGVRQTIETRRFDGRDWRAERTIDGAATLRPLGGTRAVGLEAAP